jgi:hypothetical protein
MEKRVKTFPLNLLFFLRFESSFSVYDGYTDVITRIKGVKPAAFICSHSCVFSFQTKNKKKISWRLSHHQMEGEVWPIDEGAPPHLIFHLARPERKKEKKTFKMFFYLFSSSSSSSDSVCCVYVSLTCVGWRSQHVGVGQVRLEQSAGCRRRWGTKMSRRYTALQQTQHRKKRRKKE